MLRALLCLVALVPLALGDGRLRTRQDGDKNEDVPVGYYRRRGMQGVTVLGDFIYFNGGELSNYEDGEMMDGQTHPSLSMHATMTIPHNESWDVVSLDFHHMKDDKLPPLNSAALWHDVAENRLYRWGGSKSRGDDIDDDVVVLWEFEPDNNGGGTWSTSDPANENTFQHILGATGGGVASCDRKGFMIGGAGRGATDPRLSDLDTENSESIPGILTYDMATRRWSNHSTAPVNPPYGGIVNSAASCVQGFPLGPIIFSLGGLGTSAASIDGPPLDLRNLTFWDPGSERWYWQEATGDVPSGRESPCVAGARSRDGTYEVFMYGGHIPATGTQDDMHVLSLPGFRWFKVDVDSPTRVDHSCTTVGKRQMLSTGGVTEEWDWESLDPWVHSVGIFDMTKLEWKDSFDANADDYDSPQMVKNWYNNGGMDSVQWNSDEVKAMFVDKKEDTPGSGSGSKSGDGSDDSSSNTGAIAGGVVGGVVGVGVIAALAWFIVRRRRRRESDEPAELDAPEPGSPPGDGETSLLARPNSRPDSKPSPAISKATPTPVTPVQEQQQQQQQQQQSPVEMATVGHEMHELPLEGHERAELPS